MKYYVSILSVLCIFIFIIDTPPILASSSVESKSSIGFYGNSASEDIVDPQPPGGVQNQDNSLQGNRQVPKTGDVTSISGYYWMSILALVLVIYFYKKQIESMKNENT